MTFPVPAYQIPKPRPAPLGESVPAYEILPPIPAPRPEPDQPDDDQFVVWLT